MTHHDLVIIGGGTAGIVAGISAAGVGARVTLIERARTGGDCLWTGCVPSKALIAAAKRAHAMRAADHVGIGAVEPTVDLAAVMGHVRAAQRAIEPHDSPARLQAEGIEVIPGTARFSGPDRLTVDGRTLTFRRALVATGSEPVLPPVAGLADADPLTTDTVWDLHELPPRLLVVGGGPVGCELGQAFGRLGSRVRMVEMTDRLLPQTEPQAGRLVARTLREEGVDVHLSSRLEAVEPAADGGWRAIIAGRRGRTEVSVDRILAATGRRPVTGGLALRRAGVRTDERGAVVVDEHLRTTNRRIYAAGDVTMQLPFTHVAGAHGSMAVANALFGLRRTLPAERIPWVVFTDPEVAHVGVTEADARRRLDDVEVRVSQDRALDRAVTDARTEGFSKLVADDRGRIAGATIVSPRAGELIAEIVAWMAADGTLSDLARTPHAYPTYAEAPYWAGVEHVREFFFGRRVTALTRPLLWAARQVDRLRG